MANYWCEGGVVLRSALENGCKEVSAALPPALARWVAGLLHFAGLLAGRAALATGIRIHQRDGCLAICFRLRLWCMATGSQDREAPGPCSNRLNIDALKMHYKC